MIRQIAITTRRNRQRDADTFERIGLPKIRLATRWEIAGFYKSERLTPFTSPERRSDDAAQT